MPSSAGRKGDMERQKRLSEHAEKPFPENRKPTERPFLNKMQFMEHPLSERKKAEQGLTYLCSVFYFIKIESNQKFIFMHFRISPPS